MWNRCTAPKWIGQMFFSPVRQAMQPIERSIAGYGAPMPTGSPVPSLLPKCWDGAIRLSNRSSNLWERSPEDKDFLEISVGHGQVPFHIHVKPPRADGYDKDPLSEAAELLSSEFQTVEDA